MEEKDAPSSFKKSPSPASKLSVHLQPEAQLVTQLEAKPQVKPEPVQPEARLESQGDSQVTSARSSSTAPLLSAVSTGPDERSPQERSPSPSDTQERSPSPSDTQERSPSPSNLNPLSFQFGLPETKISVEPSLSVFVSTLYFGKLRPGSKESSEEGSLPERPQTDPHPEQRSEVLVPAVKSARALDDDSYQLQTAGIPKTIPTVWESREISKNLDEEQKSLTVVKAPVVERPVGKRPVTKSPVGKPPVGKQPVGKPPVGKRPVGKPPVGKRPVGKPPVGKRPVGKPPVGKRPVGKPQSAAPVIVSCIYIRQLENAM